MIVTAIILGIVEGLTEFLPVSSTGHLIIAGHALGYTGGKADTFEIFIQAGAILAVVVLYWPRLWALLDFKTPASNSFRGVRGIAMLAAGSFPALILGAVAGHAIKAHLFFPRSVATALLAGAAAMWLAESVSKQKRVHCVEELTLRDCAIVGLFQCAALWPGISRAASTMVGALLIGVDRKIAAEFSFLLAVPVIFAATAYDLVKSWKFLELSDLLPFGVGFVVSFITAIIAVRWFISIVQTTTLRPFAIYRVFVGIAVLLFWSV